MGTRGIHRPLDRIEDEQARLQAGDGLGELAAVGIQIEPDAIRHGHQKRAASISYVDEACRVVLRRDLTQ